MNKKNQRILNIIVSCFVDMFIDSGLYFIQSAPWYTSIIVQRLLTFYTISNLYDNKGHSWIYSRIRDCSLSYYYYNSRIRNLFPMLKYHKYMIVFNLFRQNYMQYSAQTIPNHKVPHKTILHNIYLKIQKEIFNYA